MKYIFFCFLINIPLFLSINNPDALGSNYPFSVKKDNNDNNKAVIFMNNEIKIFDVSQLLTNTNPLSQPYTSSITCRSLEEKGGIFFNNYYYTSCLHPSNNNQFQIKKYSSTFNMAYTYTYPSVSNYYSFSSGTIRFFKKVVSPELIGVAWVNNGEFNIVRISQTDFKYNHYPVNHMARDVDCLFITSRNRLVCLFGIETNGKYDCSVNIFTYDEDEENFFVSNFKIWYVCSNHQSRKVRGDTDNPYGNSDLFYYYYVDTENNAYIVPMRLTNTVTIDIGPVLKVISGCDENQHSFDMAEDKFMGYNVFVCVEYRFKKRIKIQLFKIENNQIIFYENRNVDNPYEFKEGDDSEISMINFNVLKDSLNFGLLTYKSISNGGRYTIFNQPSCSDYSGPTSEDLFQNKDIEISFNSVILNDNYDGASIEIVETNPGMEVIVQGDGTTIKFTSIDYITGELIFFFKVKNAFYESDICKATIYVNNCYSNCKTCSMAGIDFFTQNCEGCKNNNYPINNFPFDNYDNCCEKDHCPSYLYFNTNINKYEICNIACLECNGDQNTNCISCYNLRELNKYSDLEKNYINNIKHGPTTNYYYWENIEHKKCVNRDNDLYIYLDIDTSTYKDCYHSCEKCNGEGDSSNHNCIRCYESNGYFHYENINSENCFKQEEVPHNYYLENSDNIGDEIKFWTICHSLCYSCIGANQNDCKSCITGAYPKCEDKDENSFECYNSIPNNDYFFNTEDNCYEKCDPNCKTCDKGRRGSTNNCLSCNAGQILFNRNCYTNCPETHYELDHIQCVSNCPDYAPSKVTTVGSNNVYNQCYNCAEIGKCIYLGKRTFPNMDIIGNCINCNLIGKTFICNEDYGILDDCFEFCNTCQERGNITKMNCLSCSTPKPCLVEELGNCVEEDSITEFYYKTNEYSAVVSSNVCVYKKCYESCKKCNGYGNVDNHNCIICKDNYQFDPYNSGNCIRICEFYWYIDSVTNILECTSDEKCPEGYPYLSKLNKQCVSDCFYAYHNGLNRFYTYKDTCVFQCPENTMKDDILYICHSLDDVEDVFIYVPNYLSPITGIYKNNLLIYSNDKKNYFHLFNTTKKGIETYEKSSINVGTSLVDFSNCISKLIEEYDYNNNEIFYIGILDVIRDDTSAPQFEYTIHNHLGEKLDINKCKNNEITIKKIFIDNDDISLAKNIFNLYGFDILNYSKENPFFCDICTLFDYNHSDPYDILLNDRYDYYYNNKEYYFCEEICNSEKTNIDFNNSRVECVCTGKNEINFETYLKQKFVKFEKSSKKCSDWLLQYLKCYKNVFSKNIFENNIGNYFILFFIIFQIFSLLIYFLVSKKPMMYHIREVLLKKSKKQNENPNENKKSNSGIGTYKKSGSKSYYSNNKRGSKSYSKSGSSKSGRSKSYYTKTSGKSESGNSDDVFSKSEKTGNRIDDNYSGSYNESKDSNNANPPKNIKYGYNYNFFHENKNNNIDNNKDINNNNLINKNAAKTVAQRYAKRFLNNRKDYLDNSYREDSYNFDIPKNKEYSEEEEEHDENENEEKISEIKEEKNDAPPPVESIEDKLKKEKFKEEINKFKKKSFGYLYWLIIRKRHRIISLFSKKDVYDIFAIKFSLLILSYTIDFFITTLLFFDFEIRKLFHIKKHIDPLYVILMGIACTLGSTILIRVVDFLMEFRKEFKQFEIQENYYINYFKTLNNMIRTLNIKIIIYFILNFIFSLFIWYMVTSFIATYFYTKLSWGIMIGINFALSNIFPFIYYLIGVKLQYKGIQEERYTLYKFAMLLLKI